MLLGHKERNNGIKIKTKLINISVSVNHIKYYVI